MYMKTGTKIMIILLAVVLIAGLLAGGLYLKSIRDYKAEVAALTFTEIDLSRVADGTYIGSCETGVVNAQVLVTVRDHTITDIQLLRHDNGRGSPAEAILDRMLQAQSTDVDTVSGATCSSRVLRKAVENALSQGISQEPPTEATTEPPLSLTPEDLTGPWHLAADKNDEAAIFDAFPGAMEFCSSMEIRSDGRMSWYIGAEGGAGTYTLSGSVLHAELVSALDGSAMTMDFTAEQRDGRLFLTTRYKDLPLCWFWGEDETGAGT